MLQATAEHDANHMKSWMEDKPENVELLLAPGSGYTRYEPLGVVAVIGSWNAPLVTTLKPMI